MNKESRHEEEEEGFTPAPIPSGGPVDAVLIGPPAPVPERIPENFICLRGPCRHYWHLVTMADSGNPQTTWEELGIPEPRQHHHTCLVNPGFETSLADDNAYECNKWDPVTDAELVQIKLRRDDYYNKNPEHKPK